MSNSSIVRVSVLGAGTVGSEVIRILMQRRDELGARAGAELMLNKVLVRNLNAPRSVDIDPGILIDDPEVALDGADVVIELIGGLEPAFTLVKRALQQGSTVITGNKALLARHGPHLYELAEEHNTDLYYEAAVAGAVPIVYGLRESLTGDHINRVVGIVNGTTNFILDQMASTGAEYSQALSQAQAAGFAEADPTADVEGHDAAAKCAIMASLAFHSRVSIEAVSTEGITTVSAADIEYAKQSGQVIKLLAVAERLQGKIRAEVFPALLPLTHPLAAVNGAYNAVILEGEAAGRLMFYGLGAGGAPTASAVLSDLVAAASHRAHGGHAPRELCYAALAVLSPEQIPVRYYLRIRVPDTAGVLAEVAGIFSHHGISLETVRQDHGDREEVHIGVTTHEALQGDINAALEALRKSEQVLSIDSILRIEE
ncbi:MAG: homoserine dehydrogenase [Actinomycetaceae bacterium]|nr:homoserine dehydrogenase [Actinomycetaceae bacterium]